MNAHWLRQALWFMLVDVVLFMAYCLLALWSPLARLVRQWRNSVKR